MAIHIVIIVLIVALFAVTVMTRVELMHARTEAKEYRALWERERRACPSTVEQRMGAIEERAKEITSKPRPDKNVEANLLGARRRFAVLLRPQERTCPGPAPCPAAAPRIDAPPCPAMTVRGPGKGAIENAERLERLQGWLREHMRAYHEVAL